MITEEEKEFKKCNSCQNLLLHEEFHKDKRRNDGLRSECKKCRKEKNSSANSKELHRKCQQRWYEKNGEQYRKKKEKKLKSYNRKWKEENRGRVR